MKRTIITSFLFLLPVNICYIYGDIFHLNLSVLCLGISVANHSHSFHSHDLIRKNGIRYIDMFLNGFNMFYSYYTALTSFNCFMYGTFNLLVLSFIYLRYLLNTDIEKYSRNQKALHALWHALVIFSMTHYKCTCIYWD